MKDIKKIGLEEFKVKVKELKALKKSNKPKLKDVAWVALRMLLDSEETITFNKDLENKFYDTFEGLMKLDNIQLNRVIKTWLNKSYIYKKETL